MNHKKELLRSLWVQMKSLRHSHEGTVNLQNLQTRQTGSSGTLRFRA